MKGFYMANIGKKNCVLERKEKLSNSLLNLIFNFDFQNPTFVKSNNENIRIQ